MPDPTSAADPAEDAPAQPVHAPGMSRSRMLLVGAFAVILVAASAGTWVTTRALHHPRDVVSTTVTPEPQQPIIDLARQATEAMFSFTAETAPGNIKSAQAMLCGKALDDFTALSTGGKLTAELQDNGSSADIGSDQYAITQQDGQQAQVLVFFARNFTNPDSGTARAPSTSYAVRYTVDTTALPMCINSIELLS